MKYTKLLNKRKEMVEGSNGEYFSLDEINSQIKNAEKKYEQAMETLKGHG